MIRLALLAFVFAAVLLYMAYKDWSLASDATEKPVEMTLQELIDRGPDGNPHITLTGFFPCPNFVAASKRSSWTKVWVPIVPLGEKLDLQQLVKPTNVSALIYSTRVHGQAELDQVLEQPKIQGMVINKIESLGSKELDKLRESYPQTNFDRCLIFEERRAPAGSGQVLLMAGGGLGLLLVGGGILGSRLMKKTEA